MLVDDDMIDRDTHLVGALTARPIDTKRGIGIRIRTVLHTTRQWGVEDMMDSDQSLWTRGRGYNLTD